MSRSGHCVSDILVYAIAFSLAAAIVLLPQRANSGGYGAGAPVPYKQPRWSNSHHLSNGYLGGVEAVPDCVPYGPHASPDYVPGVDATGRPVPPAEGYVGAEPRPPLPVEVEVHLKRKKIGKKTADITTGPMIYDGANNTINGYPLARDCAPSIK